MISQIFSKSYMYSNFLYNLLKETLDQYQASRNYLWFIFKVQSSLGSIAAIIMMATSTKTKIDLLVVTLSWAARDIGWTEYLYTSIRAPMASKLPPICRWQKIVGFKPMSPLRLLFSHFGRSRLYHTYPYPLLDRPVPWYWSLTQIPYRRMLSAPH